jgi:hypothetical protein
LYEQREWIARDVNNYFKILQEILVENDLLNNPRNTTNMNETALNVNNEPGEVTTEKRVSTIRNVTPAEKGEHVTIVGACNAEGWFLRPVAVLKGTRKKEDWSFGPLLEVKFT